MEKNKNESGLFLLFLYMLLPRRVQLILVRSIQIFAILLLIYFIRVGFLSAIWDNGGNSLIHSIFKLIGNIFELFWYGITGSCNSGTGSCGFK